MWFWLRKQHGSHWGLLLACSVVFPVFSSCAPVTPREEVQLKQATVEELTTLLSLWMGEEISALPMQ